MDSFFCRAGGRIGVWNIETPMLIHYGELTNDEFFVTEKAAREGIKIINTSVTEPIVMLKHFAENPELATIKNKLKRNICFLGAP